MKAGWKTVSLGEVCEVLDYKRRPVTKADRRAGPYPYYGATGVQDYVDEFIFDEPLVLLGEDGAKWKSGDRSAFQVSGKTWVNNHAHVLRPNREVIADEWLVYWLNYSDLSEFVTGVTVPKLNQANMLKIPVGIPSLTEQKRIVALLDEAFAGIDAAKAKSEANLDSSSGLFDMVREDLMREPDANTPSCSFDEICKIDSALVDPRENEYAEKLHVGGANIESKTGRLVALQTARQEGLKSGKFPFQKGMVLYSKIRPNLMKVARPDFEGLCSADMYPLAPVDGRVCRDYLYHLLLTERFTRFALLGSERAGMPKVNRDYLSRFTTKLPSISEQQAFASKLDALEQSLRALRELLTKKMAALQELKSSLLTQAFAGELTA